MCELYTTPEMLTFVFIYWRNLNEVSNVCRMASKEYLTRLHKFCIDWKIPVPPHFSLVPPHEGAQRLFVTDWETIEVSPSVGSAVCTSTGEVGRGQ